MSEGAIAGIDLGGTKVSVVVVKPDGVVLRRRAAVLRRGADDVIPLQACALLEELCGEAGIKLGDLLGVGISSCGPFIARDGYRAVAGPNLCGGVSSRHNAWQFENDWRSIPLEALVRARLPSPVAVVMANDCIAALSAERLLGGASNNCAYATWSTGIGFAVCVDGQVLRGKNGNAGHFGHTFIPGNNPEAPCGCGSVGDAEASLAGNGLARDWGMAVDQVFAAARGGDGAALDKVDAAAQRYAYLLFNLIVSLDLDSVLMGGAVFLHNQDLLLPRLRQALGGNPQFGAQAITAGVEVGPAFLGTAVADLGALALVLPSSWRDAWRRDKPWERWQ